MLLAAELSVQLGKRINVSEFAQPLGERLRRPLGDAPWSELRNEFLWMSGFTHLSPQRNEGVRTAIANFQSMWNHASMLFVGETARQQVAEGVFAQYLLSHADFASIWSYMVISKTPAEYKRDLRDVSIDDLMKFDQAAAMDRTIQILFAHDRSLEPPKVPEIVVAKYERQGPHPLDGFLLYFRTTNPILLGEATSYFRSPEVATFVLLYCPQVKVSH
jgi:hypothetical protein